MPVIRPSSDLRNNYNDISDFCHKNSEPIFITRNGHGDLAVMSIEIYERLMSKIELYKLIDEGLADVEEGKVYPYEQVISELRESIKKSIKNGTI